MYTSFNRCLVLLLQLEWREQVTAQTDGSARVERQRRHMVVSWEKTKTHLYILRDRNIKQRPTAAPLVPLQPLGDPMSAARQLVIETRMRRMLSWNSNTRETCKYAKICYTSAYVLGICSAMPSPKNEGGFGVPPKIRGRHFSAHPLSWILFCVRLKIYKCDSVSVYIKDLLISLVSGSSFAQLYGNRYGWRSSYYSGSIPRCGTCYGAPFGGPH